MRSSITTALVALSAAISAFPTGAPSKFAIQITATLDSKPSSFFLAKGLGGAAATDTADAASCSLTDKSELVCEGKVMGIAQRPGLGGLDMGAIGPLALGAAGVSSGFSIDAENMLHWKNNALETQFPAFKKAVESDPQYANGEVKFGLFKSNMLTGGKPMLYFQLGCPGTKAMDHMGTHGGLHDPVVEGVAKVVSLSS